MLTICRFMLRFPYVFVIANHWFVVTVCLITNHRCEFHRYRDIYAVCITPKTDQNCTLTISGTQIRGLIRQSAPTSRLNPTLNIWGEWKRHSYVIRNVTFVFIMNFGLCYVRYYFKMFILYEPAATPSQEILKSNFHT